MPNTLSFDDALAALKGTLTESISTSLNMLKDEALLLAEAIANDLAESAKAGDATLTLELSEQIKASLWILNRHAVDAQWRVIHSLIGAVFAAAAVGLNTVVPGLGAVASIAGTLGEKALDAALGGPANPADFQTPVPTPEVPTNV